MTEILLNGRFYSQATTGVQRYAREIVSQIDQLLSDGDVPSSLKEAQVTVLVPPTVDDDLGFRAIKTRRIGLGSGHFWEQTSLARAAVGKILLNLCNAAPVVGGRKLVVLHDCAIYRFPEAYSPRYRMAHRLLDRLVSRSSKIVTVSEFSRGELARFLRLDQEDISIVPNGSDHVANILPDTSLIDNVGLHGRTFFVIIGSQTVSKNIDFAVSAFVTADIPDATLVVVGGYDSAVFSRTGAPKRPNVLFTGRVSDAVLVGLLRNASALVFPSLYEGFGIPPLEAMRSFCPVLVSDIPTNREICCDAALYFDPSNHLSLVNALRAVTQDDTLRRQLIDCGGRRMEFFTWEKSARLLLNVIDKHFFSEPH